MASTVSKVLPAVLAVTTPVASVTTRYHTVLPIATPPAHDGVAGSPASTEAASVLPLVEMVVPEAGTSSVLAPAKLSLVNGVGVKAGEAVMEAVAELVTVAVGAEVKVGVNVEVGVDVDVGLLVGVLPTVGDGVEEAEAEGLAVALDVAVAEGLGVCVWVREAEGLGVGVAVLVGEAVGDGLGEGVGEAAALGEAVAELSAAILRASSRSVVADPARSSTPLAST